MTAPLNMHFGVNGRVLVGSEPSLASILGDGVASLSDSLG